jgi:drug/metabolite transporter (DMT)-like permease
VISANGPEEDRRRKQIIIALAIVYMAWGGTYLGIRFAVETIPPLIMAGSRFLLSSIILITVLRFFHASTFRWGSRSEWRDATIIGLLLLLVSNGGLCWSEQFVPSGVASLFFALTPLWMVLFDWIHPGGKRPSLRNGLGLILGFSGVWVLRGTSQPLFAASNVNLAYFILLIMGGSWGAGAIYSRYAKSSGNPFFPVARQMIVGGIALLIAAALHGDFHHFSIEQVTARSALGFGYLVVMGTLIGFTAYMWLMKESTPLLVGTTAYVNPVIAVCLGWVLGHEPLTLRLVLSAGIIVTSVIVVLNDRNHSFRIGDAPNDRL